MAFRFSVSTERKEVLSYPQGPRAAPFVLFWLQEHPPVQTQLLRSLPGWPLLLPPSRTHSYSDLCLPPWRSLQQVCDVHPVLQVQRRVQPPQRGGHAAPAVALWRYAQVQRLAPLPAPYLHSTMKSTMYPFSSSANFRVAGLCAVQQKGADVTSQNSFSRRIFGKTIGKGS